MAYNPGGGESDDRGGENWCGERRSWMGVPRRNKGSEEKSSFYIKEGRSTMDLKRGGRGANI